MSSLIPIEYQNQRVLTTQQLAEVYEADPIKIQQNFNNNRDRYIPGKHYFVLEGENLKAFKNNLENFEVVADRASRLYLWTEKGAWMHAKSLNTDRAWEAYESLIDTYYDIKQAALDYSKLSPELQMFQYLFQSMAKQELRMQQLEEKTEKQAETITAIKDTIIQQPDNWREELNKMFNKIVMTVGGKQFQEMRKQSYEELERRAGVNLEVRLRNLRARMLDAGKCKTAINEACKLDVIADDKKLREIYSKIVQELYIKHVA
jgi:molybdopterin converting factor small subunit